MHRALAILATLAALCAFGGAEAILAVPKAKGGGGWSNPYITDGLVAMWDGEWNVGGGVHDGFATVWVDLTGNGYDLPVISGVGSFGDNTFVSSGLHSAGYDPNVKSITEDILCVEVCIKSITIPNAGVFSPKEYWRNNGANVSHYRGSINIGRDTASTFSSFPITFAGNVVGDNANEPYINGVSAAKNGIYNYYGNQTWFGVSYRDPFIGEIYSIRCYSRHLTAAEIASNYAIDKARFNLP